MRFTPCRSKNRQQFLLGHLDAAHERVQRRVLLARLFGDAAERPLQIIGHRQQITGEGRYGVLDSPHGDPAPPSGARFPSRRAPQILVFKACDLRLRGDQPLRRGRRFHRRRFPAEVPAPEAEFFASVTPGCSRAASVLVCSLLPSVPIIFSSRHCSGSADQPADQFRRVINHRDDTGVIDACRADHPYSADNALPAVPVRADNRSNNQPH